MMRYRLWTVVALVGLVFGVPGPGLAANECPNDVDNWPFHWTGNKPDGTVWVLGADKVYGFAAIDPTGVSGWDGVSVAAPGSLLPADHPEDVDHNGDGVFDADPNVVCRRLTAGDGYASMADGNRIYTFGFADMTGVPDSDLMRFATYGVEQPAPTIVVKEGQEFYLALTNAGMTNRPDLFDPHTLHWHGYPNASSFFDGLPMASISVNMGQTFTYYYKVHNPGTYMYHCHVEVVEHMQMGMVGNWYVTPLQNETGYGGDPGTISRLGGNTDPAAPLGYVFNDGDGSTAYDREYAIQLVEFNPQFHKDDETVQPLNFAQMEGRLFLMNGRGYPDTLIDGPLPLPADASPNSGWPVQPLGSKLTAAQGERVLLRLSNLGTTEISTVTALGLPMRVVGRDARLLRGTDGVNLSYLTQTVTLSGGESFDILLDTSTVPKGTYHLYSRNLSQLNNDAQDRGGMMTEIVIN